VSRKVISKMECTGLLDSACDYNSVIDGAGAANSAKARDESLRRFEQCGQRGARARRNNGVESGSDLRSCLGVSSVVRERIQVLRGVLVLVISPTWVWAG
jgi:hypothetical protein